MGYKAERRQGQLALFRYDLLNLEDVVEILLAFWLHQPRPSHLFWRPIGHLLPKDGRTSKSNG